MWLRLISIMKRSPEFSLSRDLFLRRMKRQICSIFSPFLSLVLPECLVKHEILQNEALLSRGHMNHRLKSVEKIEK